MRATVPATLLTTLGTLALTAANPGSVSSNALAFAVAKPAPILTSSGVVNGATAQSGAIAPGELLAIYGQYPGPAVPVNTQLDASGDVVSQLGGIRVLFDGVAAPVLYASATQVNAVAPFGLAGKTSTSVQVEFQGAASSGVVISVSPAAPGIFAADASGHGQGAIINQDGSLNSTANPAAAGSIVAFWATGAGITNPASGDGTIYTGIGAVPALAVTAQIGGQPAEVLYAGAAPGMVSGVVQVNLRVPAGVSPGAAPVMLQVGPSATQQGLTVAVR